MKARWEEETGSQSRRRGEVLFGRKLRAFLGDLSPSFFFLYPSDCVCHHIFSQKS